jgi:hypothetical protein
MALFRDGSSTALFACLNKWTVSPELIGVHSPINWYIKPLELNLKNYVTSSFSFGKTVQGKLIYM